MGWATLIIYVRYALGTFWDLFQQVQIHKRKTEAGNLEERIVALEEELIFTQDVLAQTLQKLEQLTGQDFDGDGQV